MEAENPVKFKMLRVSLSPLHKYISYYLTPFNFRPPLIFGRGWPKIRGAEKVKPFFGWPKIKGAEIFPKHLYNIKICVLKAAE